MKCLRMAAPLCAVGLLVGSASGANEVRPYAQSPTRAVNIGIEIVDGGVDDVGRYAAAEVDEAGRLVVMYYNATTGDLKCAVKNGSWSKDVVDVTGNVGGYVSIAIDASGRRNASYYDATEGALKYAGWILTGWASTTEEIPALGNDRGRYVSVRLTPSGDLAAAYYDATTQDLLYSVKSGTWSTTPVDASGNVGEFASWTMDAAGRASASYYDRDEGALRYAGWVTPEWSSTTENVPLGLNDAGKYASAVVDKHNRICVAYHDETVGTLRFAVRALVPNVTWTHELVDGSAHVGHCISMVAYAGDDSYRSRFMISYLDVTNTALRYVEWYADSIVSVEDPTPSPDAPGEYALRANAPNPFNPATAIAFDVPRPSWVDLAVYDVAGRRVRTLVNERMPAGSHTARWNGTSDSGAPVSSGVYFCRMRAGAYAESRRMTLVK